MTVLCEHEGLQVSVGCAEGLPRLPRLPRLQSPLKPAKPFEDFEALAIEDFVIPSQNKMNTDALRVIHEAYGLLECVKPTLENDEMFGFGLRTKWPGQIDVLIGRPDDEGDLAKFTFLPGGVTYFMPPDGNYHTTLYRSRCDGFPRECVSEYLALNPGFSIASVHLRPDTSVPFDNQFSMLLYLADPVMDESDTEDESDTSTRDTSKAQIMRGEYMDDIDDGVVNSM